MDKVQWPGKAYDPSGDDVGKPIADLLTTLNLLEKPDEMARESRPIQNSFRSSPPSMQVITAGGAALSKGWATFIGAVGGIGSVLSFLKGLGMGSADPLRSAVFVGSAAAVLAAAVIAIAVIVRADVTARAHATAAEYEARARVTSALMTAFQGRNPLPVPTKYWVKKKSPGEVDDNWYPVLGFDRDRNGLLLRIDSGVIRDTEVEDWHMGS